MGKTNAERQAAWREKQKAQGRSEYLMKERKRKVAERKEWLQAKRKKESRASAERKKAYRTRIAEKKRQAADAPASQAYTSPASLGKAVSKLKQRLPRSPRKRIAVICKLAGQSNILRNQNEGSRQDRHTIINVEAVVTFFNRHISRESPGMKDTIIVRSAGMKETRRKRHLLFKLREVYNLFCEENGADVGFSTFCNLRPVNVLLSRSTPHDMRLVSDTRKLHQSSKCYVTTIQATVDCR